QPGPRISQDRLLPAAADRPAVVDVDPGGEPGRLAPAAGLRGVDDGGAIYRLPGGQRPSGFPRPAALDARAPGTVPGFRVAGLYRHADPAGESAGDAFGGCRLHAAVGPGGPWPL